MSVEVDLKRNLNKTSTDLKPFKKVKQEWGVSVEVDLRRNLNRTSTHLKPFKKV